MSQYINCNGRFYPRDEKLFSVTNRAFRYGDALFETMKVIDEKAVFIGDHLKRLHSGMKMLGMNGGGYFTEENLSREIARTMRRNHLKYAGLRLQVFRTGAGRYTPESDAVSFVIEVDPGPRQYELNERGMNIGLYDEHLKPVTELGRLKTSNALLYSLAARYKRDHGFGEVILLNQKGNLCEGTASNVFLLVDKKLLTPSLSTGCVEGVMRKHVIDIAHRGGIEVIEGEFSPDMLNKADEVFFSNALVGVKWAMSHNNRRYFNKFSSQLAGYLNGKAFDDAEK